MPPREITGPVPAALRGLDRVASRWAPSIITRREQPAVLLAEPEWRCALAAARTSYNRRIVQVLLRAAFHLSRLRSAERTRVAIIVDDASGIGAHAVMSLLRPWRQWLEITDLLVTQDTPPDDWFANAAANRAQAVSVISERSELLDGAGEAARRHGLRALRTGYEAESDRDTALMQEMSHHHYELGGLNEWDGNTVQYAPFVLQHLSGANCVRYFPQYALDDIHERYRRAGGPIEALDVGCGPISRLRWGAISGLLHITGVDPLLDVYDVVLAHHGLDALPSIAVDRAVTARAEDLDRHVAANSIDFAFSCNALDHSEDPVAVVAQVARALRPQAVFALEFATREGSRQQWRQLHRFDLFYDDAGERLMCQQEHGDSHGLVADDVPLALDRVVVAEDDYTVAVLRKTRGAPPGRRGWAVRSLLAPRT
jgi:SAM-dependent methyltransferase